MPSITHGSGTITIDEIRGAESLDKPMLAVEQYNRKGLDLTARLPEGTREVRKVLRLVRYNTNATTARTYRDSLTDIVNENVSIEDQFGVTTNDVWLIEVRHVETRQVIQIGVGDRVRQISDITVARTA